MNDNHIGTRNKVTFSGEGDSWPGEASGAFGWRMDRKTLTWRPPTDVCETEQSYLVDVELSGMRGSEIQVNFTAETLSVRGTREDKKDRKAYHQMEIAYGEFAVDIVLNAEIEVEKIEAGYSDGFLRIILPKKQPKKIEIS
jgi:HSP20 family protein